MTWKKGTKIPTNMIVGFLGSGKTSAIQNLIDGRPGGESWSILINEFGTVSIDHAMVDSNKEGIEVEELGGGCACCTMSYAFQPLLARFLRRTRPDRFVLEPSGLSHPAKVIDILRGPNFSGSIDLRNIICLIDPQDFGDPRWRETEIFYDQVQLADIVVLNWTDCRDRELIDRCREWVETFRPPKQLIVETSFGQIDPSLLDMKFDRDRFPLFSDAHPLPEKKIAPLELVTLESREESPPQDEPIAEEPADSVQPQPEPGKPLRFNNRDDSHDACGWIFHPDDQFERDKLLDLLGYLTPIVRLKGIFHCEGDWWLINRAKDGTSFQPSAYRRDSRLEIILDRKTSGWEELERKLLDCLVENR
ncbi:MAG: GTP-binding protein [Planctomycetota bacterium]|nr:GTP-binding protein [Planctomycetota bacterium]